MLKKLAEMLSSEAKQVLISGPKVADDLIYLVQRAEEHQCHGGLL